MCYEAYLLAKKEHQGQKRKYTDEPYLEHLLNVCDMVEGKSGEFNDESICAALLHDVVEDTKISFLEIREKFGSKVARLVYQVTNKSKLTDGDRQTRKQIDLLHLQKACPEAKTIKLADMIDNMPSIIEHDPEFAKVYMKEKQDLLGVLKEGDSGLYVKAKDIVDNYFIGAIK